MSFLQDSEIREKTRKLYVVVLLTVRSLRHLFSWLGGHLFSDLSVSFLLPFSPLLLVRYLILTLNVEVFQDSDPGHFLYSRYIHFLGGL